MNREFAAYCFFLIIGFLAIGTVLFADNEFFNNIWFACNWLSIIITGVYFATNTKNKWLKWSLSCLIGWVFSAFTFEIVCIFNPELLETINQPSANYVWYLLAFMASLTIITINTIKDGN